MVQGKRRVGLTVQFLGLCLTSGPIGCVSTFLRRAVSAGYDVLT